VDRLARLDRLGVLTATGAGEPFPVAREARRISAHSVIRWATLGVRGRRDVAGIDRVWLKIDRGGRSIGPIARSTPKL
jgi:hypothetical protein